MENSTQDKINDFFQNFPERSFYKGDILIWVDQQPDGIFFIENGCVRQYDISEQGKKVAVNVFMKNAFFPMAWAINKTKNEYFYEAMTDVEVRIAPAEKVVDFIRQNPEVTFDLLSRVFRGTDGTIRRISHLMSSNAGTKILYELFIEYQRSKNKYNDSFVSAMNESDLSYHTGLTRETVNRQLSIFKKSGLVSVHHGEIKVESIKILTEALGINQ
ncbi:MAG: Crp/Fnr family transcriptional regulator [Patescibacteria group bacterium]